MTSLADQMIDAALESLWETNDSDGTASGHGPPAMLAQCLRLIVLELQSATAKHSEIVSHHEGIAVIEEEFLELREEVFWSGRRPKDSNVNTTERMMEESVQLAAMALRFMLDLLVQKGIEAE